MYDRDIRDIKLFGTLAVMSGGIGMLLTFLVGGLVLLSGGSTNLNDIVSGAIILVTALVMSAALVGIGGELQRADRHSARDLRLNWTALLVVMVAGLLVGLWQNAQVLSFAAAVVLVGLVWTRGAVINLTSR